jgi:hypothetical protein
MVNDPVDNSLIRFDLETNGLRVPSPAEYEAASKPLPMAEPRAPSPDPLLVITRAIAMVGHSSYTTTAISRYT